MKYYIFKELAYSLAFLMVIGCVFAYGLIWLNDGFSREEMMRRYIKVSRQYTDNQMNKIMESAFKGRK